MSFSSILAFLKRLWIAFFGAAEDAAITAANEQNKASADVARRTATTLNKDSADADAQTAADLARLRSADSLRAQSRVAQDAIDRANKEPGADSVV